MELLPAFVFRDRRCKVARKGGHLVWYLKDSEIGLVFARKATALQAKIQVGKWTIPY
jgi:hypothetical protein